jgi:ClpA/ClpB-like protein
MSRSRQTAEKLQMFKDFTDRARDALTAAQQESRRYRHGYVGTEHILLGLVGDSLGEVAGVFKTLGVDPWRIRQGIEALIAPNADAVAKGELPFTPRATRAIEIASEEARYANQKQVDATHLLIGLLRESDGVAGKVLIGLGLNLNEVREAVLKIRHEQMKLVERTVRPVRASATRKRKMREELLAHLTGIYEEELNRSDSPTVALQAAARRFGDPASLTSELNSALPFAERVSHFIDRSVGWRPPESAARYMLRVSTGITAFVAIFLFCCLIPVGVFLSYGWSAVLILGRPLVGGLPFMFVDVWVLGVLYYKLRDTMCGAPWTRKSLPRAMGWAALSALVAFGTAIAFNAVAQLDTNSASRAFYVSLVAAAVTAIVFPIVACTSGPDEIDDTVWACLNLREAVPETAE